MFIFIRYMSSPSNDLIKKVKEIIDNTRLNITERNFVNDKSKFIIITYWWGRGNINRNTQKPCRELHHIGYNWQLKDDQKLINNPVRFEEMIQTWEDTCRDKNCNFFAQEYPEFAVPGGYQLAINAKPLFIKKVIDTLNELDKTDISVVYIDGDMTVNKYPHIFDMKNVDYMGRGWNVDPRASRHYMTSPCFDPFTFETSGGIMYFGNNENGRKLLDMWAKWSALPKFQGKADDRIISMLINSKQLYISMNILQLPIEYLWLTDAYEPLNKCDKYLEKRHYSRKNILFEHPACLTTEETARDQGAAANRQPQYYDKLVENVIECQSEGGILYEYIIFDNISQAKEWKQYLDYMSSDDAILGKYDDGEVIIPYYVKQFNDAFDDKNDFVAENTSIIQQIKNNLVDKIEQYDIINLIYDKKNSGVNKNIIYVNDQNKITSYLCALMFMKKKVVYIPDKSKNFQSLNYIKNNKDKYELICNINNVDFNYPDIDLNSPIYFNYTSEKLFKLLRMSNDVEEFNKMLKMCILNIQLIRCNFITIVEKGKSSKSKGSVKSYSPQQMIRSLNTSTKMRSNTNTLSLRYKTNQNNKSSANSLKTHLKLSKLT